MKRKYLSKLELKQDLTKIRNLMKKHKIEQIRIKDLKELKK